MCSNNDFYKFELSLPESTPKEIIEWINFAELNNNLSQQLISLIEADIKYRFQAIVCPTTNDLHTPYPSINKDDFFDILYDSETSYTNIFKV